MRSPVPTVPPDASAAPVAKARRENGIHRVLVAGKGSLLGIVTAFDLLGLPEGRDL
jgi:CBS domain-containing protein